MARQSACTLRATNQPTPGSIVKVRAIELKSSAIALALSLAISNLSIAQAKAPSSPSTNKINPDAIPVAVDVCIEKSGKYQNVKSSDLATLMEEHTLHKRAKQAIELADILIKRQPSNMPLYLMKGRNLSYLNEQEKAIAVLQESLRNCQKYPDKTKLSDAYREIANNYFEMGDENKAIGFYTKAIEVSPQLAEGYHRRSVCYSDQKKYDLAIKDLNQYIKLQPNRSRSYLWRAEAKVQKGDYKDALSDINLAIKTSPEKAGEFILYRGDLYLRLKEYKNALADYDALLKLNALDDTIWLRKGNILMTLADYKGACQAYTKTIDLTEDEGATAYLARAKAFDKLGKSKEAARDREKAAELQSKKAVDKI